MAWSNSQDNTQSSSQVGTLFDYNEFVTRDIFAALALLGLILNKNGTGPLVTAETAYKYADAMMAERDRIDTTEAI